MSIKEIWEQNFQHQYCKMLDEGLSEPTPNKAETPEAMKPFFKSFHCNKPYERQRNRVTRNVRTRNLRRNNRFINQ